ncbi:MAG: hypothetical protein WAL47_05500 [Pyrinomonadaceae bacterium]
MKNELGFLNLICIVVGLLFIAAAVLVALFYPPLLSTDNLFIIMVCMVMALMFMSNPLLYLHSEGRLPTPFAKRLGQQKAAAQVSPPLLDAKGRAVPPDVKAMMAGMNRPRQNQPR